MAKPVAIRLRSFNQTISALSNRPLKVIDDLEKISRFDPAQVQAAMQRIANALKPHIRAELDKSFRASGIKSRSGALYRASVTGAFIETKRGGFIVRMAQGAKKDVYARAGVFRYGGVRAPLAGSIARDTVTGRILGYKVRSVLGARAKRTLKRGALSKRAVAAQARTAAKRGGSAAGAIVMQPKAPFFKFNAEQVARIRKIQQQLVAAELSKLGLRVSGQAVA